MNIELVVLDMAGTAVDEGNVVYKTVREAINAAGYTFTQDQVQEAGAGKEKSQAIRDVLALDGNEHSDEEVAAIFSDFQQRLARAYANLDVREQPGASELFGQLRQRGIRIALNTGYDRATALGLVEKIGWTVGKDIDAVVTASDVSNGRPAPDMIVEAMRQTGITNPAHVAKIGDSRIDIEEAHNAKCGLSIGVTTGAQTAAQLSEANPTAIIDRLIELIDLMETT